METEVQGNSGLLKLSTCDCEASQFKYLVVGLYQFSLTTTTVTKNISARIEGSYILYFMQKYILYTIFCSLLSNRDGVCVSNTE